MTLSHDDDLRLRSGRCAGFVSTRQHRPAPGTEVDREPWRPIALAANRRLLSLLGGRVARRRTDPLPPVGVPASCPAKSRPIEAMIAYRRRAVPEPPSPCSAAHGRDTSLPCSLTAPRHAKGRGPREEPRPAQEMLAGKLRYTSPAGRIAAYIGDAAMMKMCRACDG